MCPNKAILSIYFDGELPGVFREKVERHVERCPRCAAALKGFAGLSEKLRESEMPCETALARVWEALETRMGFHGEARRKKTGARNAFWRREVRLPLPLAAAAAFAVAAGAVFTYEAALRRSAAASVANLPAEETLMSFPEEDLYETPAGAVNAANMREVIQYLESDGDSNIFIIKLPESGNFNRYGEPRLINAADHPLRRSDGK